MSFYRSTFGIITSFFRVIHQAIWQDMFSHRNGKAYLLPVLAIIALSIAGSSSWHPGSSIQAATVANNKYGLIINGPSASIVRNNLTTLQMGWWYEFTESDTNPSGYNKVLLIRTPESEEKKTVSELQALASKNPGAYWMIGNEPNVPGQDNISASGYAELFNYYATNVKAIDSNAKLVGPNILNWDDTCSSCGGFTKGHTWVDSFRTSYQSSYGSEPPIDVWGIHAYYINWGQTPMVDYQKAIDQLAGLRQYLNGSSAHSSKPIWVTEFGVIWGYDGYQGIGNSECSDGSNCLGPTGSYRTDLIKDYMNGLLGWLNTNSDSQNIQKWFIYTSYGWPEPYSSVYGGISLFDNDTSAGWLNELGMLYAQLAGSPISSPCPPPSPTPNPNPGGGGGGGGGGDSSPTPSPSPTLQNPPSLVGPASGTVFSNLAPLLSWSNPPGTTQYNIHIIPANDDGPAITLIRNAESSYQVLAPKLGQGNYVMLPGMTYTWKVRTTNASVSIGESDSRWSNWASGTFITAAPSSNTISPVSPALGTTVSSLTPTVAWQDANDKMFYYEVQVSKDPTFNTDPGTATAMVYWELRHGGETIPMNSYTVPDNYPLEPKTTYFWRVRARVQGDGTPVAWSPAWSFQSP